MMNGLPFSNERRDKVIKLDCFLFGKADAGTGFGADLFILLLRKRCGVKVFF